MAIAFSILLFLHIVGAAMVFGIWLGTFKKGIVLPGQFHAALLQVVTGFGLYFIQMAENMTLNHMMIGIKIVLALVITGAAFMGQKKYKAARALGTPESGRNVALAHTVGGLALINIAIAVFMQYPAI
ncbi:MULTISPECIES: hypothetical protein [Rothia]|uniref:DUF2269 family protein n=1 Tax=Rothia nasimurium TaxID=85336 RepID=A0A1Y1RQS4_9MICC|nr:MULTISPECIES: hypothetical protein [Rothia]ORC18868.1 hypothetical protein A7979_02400 [Rothia nasimurium]